MRYSRGKSDPSPAPRSGKSPSKDKTAPNVVGNQATLRAVRAGFASPSHPLVPSVRAALDRRLATDTSPVRLHTGPAAEQAAEAAGARAFTAGRDIVLGAGVQPSASDPTLVHEAIHAKQQAFAEPGDAAALPVLPSHAPQELAAASGNAAVHSVGPVALARQPASTMPQLSPSFHVLYRRFENTSDMLDPDGKRSAALEALAVMTQSEHAREGGNALMEYFFSHGMPKSGERVMKKIVDQWVLEHVGIDTMVPAATWSAAGPPATIMEEGKRAARADNHARAFRLLGTAYLLFSFQADDAADRRQADLAARPAPADFSRSFLYVSLEQVYDSMREILGFYHQLADEARAAGDVESARAYSGLAFQLYVQIRQKYIWENDPQMVAEAELVATARGGAALRIHGANNQKVDVTSLPGLAPPTEATPSGALGSVTSQWQSAGALTDALHNQVSLMVELRGEPEIQKEFGGTEIDMNNLDHRLRVWRTMLPLYSARSSMGSNGLSGLMDLIERYLRAFTFHTAYNVPDFGRSYLEDNEGTMPSDLAGRLERDCGVYALTVAYEVYRTARAASPRLNLAFRIFTMLDHVTLVIDDRDNNEFYIVNNDQITPARRGDPMQEVAKQYRPMRGVEEMVTPSFEVSLGDTSLGDAQFRKRAWAQYEDAASWILATPPGKTRQEVYEAYYKDEKTFDDGIPRLHARLNELSAELAGKPQAEHLAIMNNRMPRLVQGASPLFVIFLTHGPGPALDLNTDQPDPARARRLEPGQRFLLATSIAGPHPLVRLAMALTYWQSLGGTLDTLSQTYLEDFHRLIEIPPPDSPRAGRGVAVPLFRTQFQSYRGGPVF